MTTKAQRPHKVVGPRRTQRDQQLRRSRQQLHCELDFLSQAGTQLRQVAFKLLTVRTLQQRRMELSRFTHVGRETPTMQFLTTTKARQPLKAEVHRLTHRVRLSPRFQQHLRKNQGLHLQVGTPPQQEELE